MDSGYDIAIIGLSCRLPGARNVDEFWLNLAGGVESITRLSDEEILQAGVPAESLSNPAYVKAAPVLDHPGHFDAAFFGYSPIEARTIDPQQRLLLELAYEALEDAGCDPDRYRGRIGVFTGAALNTYFTTTGLSDRLTEDYIPTLIGNDKDFLSTRISYKLNLKGPSITVQTACSTSMVAVHLARQSLLSGETDMALTGAVSVRVPHPAGYLYEAGGVLSPDGHVRAFDAHANGTVFGSGGGVLVLKRLADALADGDTVHAVIKGSAVNNDGSEKAAYTAPSVNAQAEVVVEALANAGIDADSITYLEAHGSGTPIGDPIEIRALTKAFRSFTQRSGYCAIGSVKTNVGHLDAAAGVTGIIKTVLALTHRQVPPSLHFRAANPDIDFGATPFYVNTGLREWTHTGRRCAGVMSTGMGGTNAHVILEEAPDPLRADPSAEPHSWHLLPVSAKTPTALDNATKQLAGHLARHPELSLGDVAYTLQTGRKGFNHRRMLVCESLSDAARQLDTLDPRRLKTLERDTLDPDVVFMFPGQGSQYVNMGRDLYQSNADFRTDIDRCADILRVHLGCDLREIVYPSEGTNPAEAAGTLQQTAFAQPALFAIEWALAQCWTRVGVRPAAMIGHSIGEYVAACLAGVFDLEDALALVAARGRLMQQLPTGAMLAVSMCEPDLRSLLADTLSIAAVNATSLCIVSGENAEIDELAARLASSNVECRRLQTSHAFHSRMMEPILEAFAAEVERVRLQPPRIPFVSNVTGAWITPDQATAPWYWTAHLRQTVRFADGLSTVLSDPTRVCLEVGPGSTLSTLAMQHPTTSKDHVILASTRHPREAKSDVATLLGAIGELWLAGVQIDWSALHPQAPRRRVSLPAYPFERTRCWIEPSQQSPTAERFKKRTDPGEWIYVPSWKRTPCPSDVAARAGGPSRWLLFSEGCGLADTVARQLRSQGDDVVMVHPAVAFEQRGVSTFTIDPRHAQHHEALFDALDRDGDVPARIAHFGGMTRDLDDDDSGSFDHSLQGSFWSATCMAKALGRRASQKRFEITFVSDGMQEVTGDERLRPEKAMILGPCRVISQEYPGIVCRSVDVTLPRAGTPAERVLVDQLCAELRSTPNNPLVAYRGVHRWVRTYESVYLSAVEGRPSRLRDSGVYLITGGLGGVGFTIATYLAASISARLVLVNRTRLPEARDWDLWLGTHARDDKTSKHIRRVRALQQSGAQVMVASADVANRDEMEKVVRTAHERFGNIHGVVHAAGVPGGGIIELKTFDAASAILAPKVQGTMVLDDIFAGADLDFVVLCSSLNAVLGRAGQLDYAAANAFLDAFAQARAGNERRLTVSIAWDAWSESGMAAEAELPSTLAAQRRKELDLGITDAEGVEVFRRVLHCSLPQVTVSTRDLERRIDECVNLEMGHAPELGTVKDTPPSQSNVDAPRHEIEQRIARIWQDALGIGQVGIHDNFTELGGHSLLAIRIVNELRRAFQVDLPVRVVFDAPTVAELSSHIKERLIADIETLTDDEAERLLSSN